MADVGILLVESRTLMREGIKQLLNGERFRIVGEANDLEDAWKSLSQNGKEADLVLFDFHDAVDIEREQGPLAALRRSNPGLRIVALSDKMCMERLSRAVNAGVDGFLLRDISPSALRQSIQLVMLGEKVFPAGLALWLARRTPGIDTADRGPIRLSKPLSGREMEILRGVMAGRSNKQIANDLNITEGTVKVHLKGILKKINVRNRTQAAVWALNQGLPASVEEAKRPMTA